MRTFLLLFLFANSIFAQVEPPPPSAPSGGEKTYELFDITKPPAYPGGEKEMLKFLSENIKYPALARENNIQGTVALTFVVDKDGSVTEVQIIKDIGGGCGKEAWRVVKTMPKWTPGEANGQPVKVRYTLPLRFKLDDDAEPAPLVRQLDSATVWKGVRIAAEQFFDEKNVEPSFKIKNKKKRAALVTALEGQFQVNVAEAEIKSFKRAGDLSNYFFQAQQGAAFFSKSNFQGKIERFATDRGDCDKNFDCLNFIGSIVVPKGWKVSFFSQADFKGEQLSIDASKAEVRIADFSKISFSETISTTKKSLNWREAARSVRVKMN